VPAGSWRIWGGMSPSAPFVDPAAIPAYRREEAGGRICADGLGIAACGPVGPGPWACRLGV